MIRRRAGLIGITHGSYNSRASVAFHCERVPFCARLWHSGSVAPDFSRGGAEARGGAGETMELDDITGEIVDTAIQIHRDRGPGLLESLYEALLACELRRRRLHVDRQQLIRVSCNGIDIEDAFRADLIVEERVIIEVKSVERTAPVHQKQLLTYLRLTNLRVGLLLNFGLEVMTEGIRRVVNDYEPPPSSPLRINRPGQDQPD
jgi:iron complex transport system substrate-binding protein